MEITPVIPHPNAQIDFDEMDCAFVGPVVNIIEENEFSVSRTTPVIELIGTDSKIKFFTDCNRPYLVLNFKTMKRFMNIIIVCVDDTGNERILELSNRISFITIDENNCKIPMKVGDGWQYLCIDLDDLLSKAFGSALIACREVIITGTCRLSKIYFQSNLYSDVELPAYLRLVNE